MKRLLAFVKSKERADRKRDSVMKLGKIELEKLVRQGITVHFTLPK